MKQMDYKLTTNKTEMERFYSDYYILSPGKYQNIYENEILLFLNDNSLDLIEDLLGKLIGYYDRYQFEYTNKEQLNILENELLKRLAEIKENKEVTGIVFEFDENMNKKYYETLNNNISEYKNIIIETLESILEWIKSNNGKGMTIYSPREYKLITDKNELDSLYGYYEFLLGQFRNERYNDNSVFIYSSYIKIIEDLINKSIDKLNEQSNLWGVIFFDKNHSTILENKLSERIIEIKENKEITGNYFPEVLYESLNREIKIYKNDIMKMLDELFIWIEMNKENGITLLHP